jgi:hypothetical protein
MKASIILVLVLLLGAASALAGYSTVNMAEVTSAVSQARTAEPAQLLICGAALIVLSVAVRRASLALPKR